MQADWTLEVLRGGEEVARALTPERVRDWERLAQDEKKVTVFQSPGFVLTWYEVYEPEYEPLLLIAGAVDGALMGVMPLALPRRDAPSPVFAGAEHCEYAGWLAVAGLEEEFPSRCAARLHQLGLFRGSWNWKWLAPGTSLGWLEHPALRERGIAWRVTEFANPIWTLSRPDGVRFFDKHKSHKWKINRLKRLGEVRLVELEAATLTDDLFEAFTTLYDVRQLARYGVDPFGDDPLKGVFHRRLVERAPDTVLFFALMAGPVPVAFNFSLVDKRRAVACMSPFDLRWSACSPGRMIGDLVSDTLSDRGMEEFDLTPGGDTYKEQVANKHETVHRIELFALKSRARLHDVRRELRSRLKPVALALGLSRERAQGVRALLSLARGRPPLALALAVLRLVRRWVWSKDVSLLYRLDRDSRTGAGVVTMEPGPPIHQDSLGDFLRYTGSNRWISRQRLMAEAIERLDQGEHCYTIVENGVLVHYGWIQPNRERIEITETQMHFAVGPNTAVLYDFYTEPSAGGRGLYKRTLRHIVREAFEGGAKSALIGVMDWNLASRRVIERTGFRLAWRLVRRRFLGWSMHWEIPVS